MAPPPAIDHQRASGKLFRLFANFAEEHKLGEVLEAPCGVRLPNQTVPLQPDILFVCQEHRHIIGTNYVEGAPDLIVEILSPSTHTYDRETKFNLYQEAGVTEYWLVDYAAKTVEVFTLTDGAYNLVGLYTGDGKIEAHTLTGFTITPNTLFNF